jgi:hypothetical protein
MTQQNERPDDDRGINDPGPHGEDWDIIGKRQEDLTAEDLKGDSRSAVTPNRARERDNNNSEPA